ncbi:MAG TPA: serine/threonine-protein kinase [Candidatus Acidoferrum sp.]|nr:serine/threonine-protein kinase [Candidatus Acidoferrum sp.]
METTVKAGRYEILGELGRGAMGVVYRANDPVIGRTVAVKTIRLSEEGTGLSRPELLSRFQTEARAAGLLTHPNIVVVYDAGEENGLYYITMELIEGKSLQALLDSGHSFPVPRVLRIMEQTCSALQFAHERSIIHRDIKPANLMLTADDTVKVTDFGTAKILQFGTVQQTTHVMGTPSYMSPEQVKGRPVDGRSDIFSLGVLLYEILTGEKPFPGQSITTVIYKIVNEDPIPPRTLNSSIHQGLSDIVMRALAKEPEVRYQSCRELLEDLRNYRALTPAAGNPDATLISPRSGTAFPLGIAGGNPQLTPTGNPNVTPTIRSLQNRGGNPTQTPVVRRTGTIAPVIEEPKRASAGRTILLGLLLVAVIVYGFNKLRPEFQATRELNNRPRQESPAPATPVQKSTPSESDPPANSAPPTKDQPSSPAVVPPPVSAPAPTPAKSDPVPTPVNVAEKKIDPPAAKPEPKKAEPTITAAAAEYKGQIEAALADRSMSNRVKVSATSNTIMLTGKLRPAEHSSLLHFMRNAPASVHVVDEISYDDTPLPASPNSDNSGHPIPSNGNAAVHVLTNVIGAKATIFGPSGRPNGTCQTPCGFNDLAPGRYSLQVQKEGYLQVQTALELKTGDSQDQKILLEALAKGLFVGTRPAGADIFINGDKQAGQTPVTLPLAPGSYNLVLRLEGYEPYSGQIQVKDNVQTSLDLELKPRAGHVAWAQVDSTPSGAEILVDGISTGQFSPARVQIPTGTHTIGLHLKGYEIARRGIQASEGGTVNVNATLQAK